MQVEHRLLLCNIFSQCPTFNKIDTAKFYRGLVEEVPEDHDTSDMTAAMQLARRLMVGSGWSAVQEDRETLDEAWQVWLRRLAVVRLRLEQDHRREPALTSIVEEQLERFADRESLLSAKGKDGTLVDADLSFIDLHGLDLSNLDLSGALFTGSDLRGVTFEGSNLTSVFAQDAEMDEVNFRDVNLSQSIFQRVSLSGGDFSGSDLTEIKFFYLQSAAGKFYQGQSPRRGDAGQ